MTVCTPPRSLVSSVSQRKQEFTPSVLLYRPTGQLMHEMESLSL
jgi:hypothetical protein